MARANYPVNLISGLLPLDNGRLVLDGVDLTAVSLIRVRHGLSRCSRSPACSKRPRV